MARSWVYRRPSRRVRRRWIAHKRNNALWVRSRRQFRRRAVRLLRRRAVLLATFAAGSTPLAKRGVTRARKRVQMARRPGLLTGVEAVAAGMALVFRAALAMRRKMFARRLAKAPAIPPAPSSIPEVEGDLKGRISSAGMRRGRIAEGG